MARAIDASELIVEIQACSWNSEQDKERAEDLVLGMPTITPPNEPMTLEQLREIKDEPVYLKVFDPLLQSGWHIIKAVTQDKIIFRELQKVYVPIKGLGVTYNLYRRPPEGEEET